MQPVFVLGDKLPWVHEAVISIISYAPGNHKNSERHRDAVNAYAKVLHTIWCKSFGAEHIVHIDTVKKQLEKHFDKYFNHMTNKKLRNSHSKRDLIRI